MGYLSAHKFLINYSGKLATWQWKTLAHPTLLTQVGQP